MNPCTRSLDLLDAELTEADRAHVAACADCSLLLGAGDPLQGGSTPTGHAPLPPPPAQALEALKARPRAASWKRPLWILAAVQLAVLVGAGVFFSLRAPQPANTAPMGTLLLLGAAILAHLVVTGWMAFRPRWQVGAGRVLGASGVLLMGAVLWGGSGAEIRPTWEGILHCIGVMAVLVALPWMGALQGLREMGSHGGRAFAAGASATGVGLLLLHVVCPEGTGTHLLLGHLLPWVMFAAGLIWMRGRVPTRSHAP
ncbi:MAG TPA: hypothetical protein VK013_05665 [Myxococcaceae bacterium]|nr:hypothetical protein [Myxococcaceae bacterium]